MAAYTAMCWVVVSLLISPQRVPHDWSPQSTGLPAVEDITFHSYTDSIALRGWLVPSTGDAAVILAHGWSTSAGHCSHRDLVGPYVRAGFHVLAFDLRGHGRSGGAHGGLGVLDRGDLRSAIEMLKSRGVQPGRIGVHGQSYGAIVATLAAVEIDEIGAIIADGGPARLTDALGFELNRVTGLPAGSAALLLPGMRCLGILLYGLDTSDASLVDAIAQVSPRPVLLIYGTEDPVIPFERALQVRAAAGPAAEFWKMQGSAHTQGTRMVPDCDTRSPWLAEYVGRTVGFMRQHLQGSLAPGE